MIKNAVFDWSGTLSDDFETVYHAMRAVFHRVGVAPLSFSQFQEVIDVPYESYLKALFRNDPETLEKFSDVKLNNAVFNRAFRAHGFPKPFPGVQNLLENLKDRGFRMAVFSSHHQSLLEEENSLFFRGKNYFTVLYGSAGNKLESVSKMLERTNFNPEETVFVGDTTHDILAGQKAGMKTAAVLTGYHLRDKLASLNPDFILDSVSGLREVL